MQSLLPPAWVDRLFGRLAVRYGSAWLRMWEGLDMAAVKADWAQQLAGMHLPEHEHMLKYGVEHLPPERPPTAPQFRAICMLAPAYLPRPALEGPKFQPDLEAVARVKSAIAALGTPKDPRAWARNLKARHESGEVLTPAQVDAYTDALRGRHQHVEQAAWA